VRLAVQALCPPGARSARKQGLRKQNSGKSVLIRVPIQIVPPFCFRVLLTWSGIGWRNIGRKKEKKEKRNPLPPDWTPRFIKYDNDRDGHGWDVVKLRARTRTGPSHALTLCRSARYIFQLNFSLIIFISPFHRSR